VDPNNPGEIRDAIAALDQQPALRAGLIQRGLARVNQFTWEEPSQTVRSVYLKYFGLE
jgi:glycosyltransferase involved in cell wall biosynthesis